MAATAPSAHETMIIARRLYDIREGAGRKMGEGERCPGDAQGTSPDLDRAGPGPRLQIDRQEVHEHPPRSSPEEE